MSGDLGDLTYKDDHRHQTGPGSITYHVEVEHGRRRPDAVAPEHGPVTPAYLHHPVDKSYVQITVEPHDKTFDQMDQEAHKSAYDMASATSPHDMVTKTRILHVEARLVTASQDPYEVHPNLQRYRSGGIGHLAGDESRSTVGMVPIHTLEPMREHDGDNQNPGDHDRRRIEEIKADLRSGQGLHEPLQVFHDPDRHWGYIGEGNHRLRALAEEGHTHAPVRVHSRSRLGHKQEQGIGAPLHLETNFGDGDYPYTPPDVHPHHFAEFTPILKRQAHVSDEEHDQAWAGERGSMDGYKPQSWHHQVNEAYHLQRIVEEGNEERDWSGGRGEEAHARENGYQRSKITDFRKHMRQPDEFGHTAKGVTFPGKHDEQLPLHPGLGTGMEEQGLYKGTPQLPLYRALQLPHPDHMGHDVRDLLGKDHATDQAVAHHFVSHAVDGHNDRGHHTTLGIHWSHDSEATQDLADHAHNSDWGNHGDAGHPVMLEADHPGHEHVLDYETTDRTHRDHKVVSDTVGTHDVHQFMLPEVPVRPGAPMHLRAIHVQKHDGTYHRIPVGLHTQAVASEFTDWRPHDRLFGPTKSKVDPRLFGSDRQMLPAVRDVIMEMAEGFLSKYSHDWQNWARVYLAGSEASLWWGNNDFDILVGIHYDRFRSSTGKNLRDEEITDLLNADFRAHWNDEDWHPPFRKHETWHLTGYVNQASWDIRNIKPYAAYEVVSQKWFVEPVEVPKDWGPDKFPESTWRIAENYANEIGHLHRLGPGPTQQRHAQSLFEHIHADRKRAFGPSGTGVFDVGNVAEKYLDQRPDHPLALLVAMKNQDVAKTAMTKQANSTTSDADGHLVNPVTGGKDWHHGTPHKFKNFGEDNRTDEEWEDHEASQDDAHWNTFLGTHWTSLHDTARKFARGLHHNQRSANPKDPGEIHTAHLGITSPAHFHDEEEMDGDAFDHHWDNKTGNHDREDPHRYHDEVCDQPGCHVADHGDDDVAEHVRGEYKGGNEARYLQLHPYKQEIADDFRNHLRSKGHDGITYGNSHPGEGPVGHTCAITFHDHQIQNHRIAPAPGIGKSAVAMDHGPLPDGYSYRHIVHQPRFGNARYGDKVHPPSQEDVYNEGPAKAFGGAHMFEHQVVHKGVPVAKLRYSVHPDEPHVLNIEGLAVHQDHQKLGLAIHLGDRMQDHARNEGCKVDHGTYTDQGHYFATKYMASKNADPSLHLPYPDKPTATTGADFMPHMLDPEEIRAGSHGRTAAVSWDWQPQAEDGWVHYAGHLGVGWAHDDDEALQHKEQTGSYHPSLGRVLHGRLKAWHSRTASLDGVPIPDHEQEARLAPGVFREQSKPQADPSDHVVAGARSYCTSKGMADPHDIDYAKVKTTADNTRSIGRAFHSLPEHDPDAVPHFESMRKEIHEQFHHMTHVMGIKAHFVDEDPYSTSKEMMKDVHENRTIKVLKTSKTGGHPFFSDEENDKFRAVHDVFGHAATGRGFDKHGEEAAYTAHSKMFSAHAQPAMETETRGQNHFYNLNGRFAKQKVAILGKATGTYNAAVEHGRTALRRVRVYL